MPSSSATTPLVYVCDDVVHHTPAARRDIRIDPAAETIVADIEAVDVPGLGAFSFSAWKTGKLDGGTVRIGEQHLEIAGLLQGAAMRVEVDGRERIASGLEAACVPAENTGKIRPLFRVFVGWLDEGEFAQQTRDEEPAEVVGLWSNEALTAAAHTALSRRFGTVQFTVREPLRIVATGPDDREAAVQLVSMAHAMRGDPRRFEAELETIAQSVAAAFHLEGSPDKTPDQLVPRLCRTSQFEGHPIVRRPLAGDVVVTYAFDLPHGFHMVSLADQQRLGLETSELHEQAIGNLWGKLPWIHRTGPVAGGPMMLTAGGHFEAALILLPQVWEELADLIAGDPICAIPARDLLFVAGSEQPEAVARIAALAHDAIQTSAYPITAQLMRRKHARWTTND